MKSTIFPLAFIFRKKTGLVAFLSALTATYAFGNVLFGKMSTASLAILAMTIFAAIGAFAAAQREGMPALVDENGDELLVTIDDDDEFDRVADAFEDTFMGEIDLDSTEE